MARVAFITEPASVKSILEHLGLPTEPPRVAPARAPPELSFDFDQPLLHDLSMANWQLRRDWQRTEPATV